MGAPKFLWQSLNRSDSIQTITLRNQRKHRSYCLPEDPVNFRRAGQPLASFDAVEITSY